MSGAELLVVLVVVVLVVGSAVLAAAETALTHLDQARAAALEERDDSGDREAAGTLIGLIEQREKFLQPVLLLLLLAHLGVATLVAVVSYRRWGVSGVLVALAVEIVVLFVVTEAAPKTYALHNTGRAALRVAPLVRRLAAVPPLRWVCSGLVWTARLLLPGRGRTTGPDVSEEELLALAGVAADAEVIEVEERALIQSIIEFGDTVVREVMVPRTDVISVGADFQIADVMEVAVMNGFSRLPTYSDGIDDVVGIAYAKDLMRAELDGHSGEEVSTILRAAHYAPETKRVSELLREMQAEQYHIAIVIDEYGGTAGIVTMEDLIEELVGEIVDEFDVEDPMIEPMPGGEVLVNARMPVDELNDLLGADLPNGDWDTVGGLLYNLLGHVPVEGEAATSETHRLCAHKVQGRRIGRVRIRRLTAEEAAAGAENGGG